MAPTIDLFNQREMVRALEQVKPPATFLLDLFFREEDFHDTDTVDIDFRVETRRMARFVGSQDMESTVVKKTPFETRSVKLPYIGNKQATTANDILQNRGIGEALYSKTPLETRARIQVGKDLADLRNLVTRREEWMAAQALQTGKVPIIGQGINTEVDFLLPADHLVILAGDALWDNVLSDPIKRLRILRRKAGRDSNFTPTDCIMGADALDAFLAHPVVQAYLEVRNYKIGEIEASDKNVVTSYGKIEGMNIWSYDDYYVEQDADGTVLAEREMIDPERIILGSTMARTTRHYGAIKMKNRQFASLRFLPTQFDTDDPVVDWLRVQSSPLPALHQSDAFITATVL